MRRPLFSLEVFNATHTLPSHVLSETTDPWQSDEDRIVVVRGGGGTNTVDGCSSYSAADLDGFGLPRRFRFEAPFSSPEPDLIAIVIQDATIIGDTGVVLNRDGAIVLESLFPPDRAKPFESIRGIPEFSTCGDDVAFDEDVFLLFRGGGFNNYWHFHMDMLPIATFVREHGLDHRFKLAVPTLKPWHESAFEMLGVQADRVINVAGRVARFRKCVILSTMFHPAVELPNATARLTFQRLHDRAVAMHGSPIPVDNLSTPSFIYVARSDSVARMLLNEVELMNALEAIGFKIVVPSQLSYEEQMLSFATASLIVGAHGAGLTNIFATQPNALLVEIFPFAVLDAPHYFFLSKTCGLNYELYISTIKSHVSPHDFWTLDVLKFLIRLLGWVEKYQLARKDDLLHKFYGDVAASGIVISSSRTISFGMEAAPYPMTFSGFSAHEPWGCWLVEREGFVLFHFELPPRFTMTLDVVFYAPSLGEGIVIEFAGVRHAVTEATTHVTFEVDNMARRCALWFEAAGAVSPAKHLNDHTQDDRSMSIGIKTITIQRRDN